MVGTGVPFTLFSCGSRCLARRTAELPVVQYHIKQACFCRCIRCNLCYKDIHVCLLTVNPERHTYISETKFQITLNHHKDKIQ